MSYPSKSCEAMQELIALDAGGDLDRAEEQRLESHLASCPACRDCAVEMRHSVDAVRRLGEAPVAAEVLGGVRSAVLQEIESQGRRPASILSFPIRTLRAHRRWLAAAAAVLLTVAAGWWLATRGPDRAPSPLPKVVRYEPPPPIVPSPGGERPAVTETIEARTAAVEPPPRERRRTPAAVAEAVQPASQPMVVKWLVDDPDLVIYWLIETDEANKEKTHEPKET